MLRKVDILTSLAAIVFVVVGGVSQVGSAVAEEVSNTCPSTIEEAFGKSFSDLRDNCFVSSLAGEPRPSCDQLRVLATDKVSWVEGVLAHKAESEFCEFDLPTYPTASSVANEGKKGAWLANITYDEPREECPPPRLAVTLVDGVYEASSSDLSINANVRDGGWLVVSNEAGMSGLGPVENVFVHDAKCGFGKLVFVEVND